MKIVHLCLCGTFTDGWSYQENMLTKFQAKSGHNVTVIASQWIQQNGTEVMKTSKTNYINAEGVRILRLPIKNDRKISYRFKRYCELIETIKKEYPDVLFIHGCQFLDILKLPNYLKERSIKVYVDNHADFSNSAANLLSKYILHGMLWRHCAKTIEPYVDRFYGVLPARVDFLADIYRLPKEKVQLLVMGADDELVEKTKTDDLGIQTRNKYQIQKNDFLLVTGGKIDSAKKQILLLLDAVNRIKNERLKLLIFGSIVPELKEAVLRMCDGNKIQFVGWADNMQTYAYFAAADLAVFPGRHSVYWEQATGQGIPLLIKHWPGTHHVDLGGNVDFIKEDSVEEITKKIEAILNNPSKYKEMKQIAIQKGMAEFSYKKIAKKSIGG